MLTWLKILLYAVVSVVLGSLLAPWLYQLGQWAIAKDWLPGLRVFAFAKYVNRAILLVALALLIPLLRALGIRKMADLYLRKNPQRLKDFFFGLTVGLLSLSLVGLWVYLRDLVVFHGDWSLGLLANIFASALVVSVLEEMLFRGVLFGILQRQLPRYVALVSLSGLFAALHFVRLGPLIVHKAELGARAFAWSFNFASVAAGLQRVVSLTLWREQGLLLFLASLLLGYTVLKTRSLYMAIGFHTGWVFIWRALARLTRRQGMITCWFGAELNEGLAPILILCLSFILLWWSLKSRSRAGDFA